LRLIREDTLYIERRLISDEKWQLDAGDDSFPLEWPLRGKRERDCELWTRVSPQRGALEDTFLRELSEFPLGEFSDQVDAFVHALSWFSRPAEFQHLRYEAMVICDPRDEQQSYEDWKWERDTLESPW